MHPGPDHAVQRRRVRGGQYPPDGCQVRHRAGQAQPGAQPRRRIGGPLGDRRVRPRPGQSRADRDGQDRGQGVADSPAVTRIGGLRQGVQQALRHGGPVTAAEQGKLVSRQRDRRG